MRTAIVSVTSRGAQLGQKVAKELNIAAHCYEKEGKTSGGLAQTYSSLRDEMEHLFSSYDRILFIMATGIVVRLIAPYVVHKSSDPAVLVMDEGGHHVISLLSGHLGGANEWTRYVALATGADPVITTATDVNQLPAPDVLARQLGLVVDDFEHLRTVNAGILTGQDLTFIVDSRLPHAQYLQEAIGSFLRPYEGKLVSHIFQEAISPDQPWLFQGQGLAVLVTDKALTEVGDNTLVLVPKTVTIGIGCRRGTEAALIEMAVRSSLSKLGLSTKAILTAASVDLKADEQGLLDTVIKLGWPIRFYSPEEMAPFIEAEQLQESTFVKHTIGVGNICETTALLAAKSRILLQGKTIYPRTTVAVAQVAFK